MYIEVIVPVSIPTPTLTYRCECDIEVGCRVVVRLGRHNLGTRVTGLVASINSEVDENIKARIADIESVVDHIPVTNEKCIEFWKWLASYYMYPLGSILRKHFAPMLSPTYRAQVSLRRLPSQTKLSVLMPDLLPFKLDENVATTLIHELSPLNVASLVDELMALDGHILVLVPSVSKGRQISKFLSKWWNLEQYYSATNMQARGECSVKIAMGLAHRLVVGTREALSLPFDTIGAIIVLDEHSSLYRSINLAKYSVALPQYGARDAALYLANLHKAKTVLVSPAPSMESYFNALNSGWQLVQTPPNEAAALKSIVLERGKDMISLYLRTEITDALRKGGKAVIFQNRRGYASWVECEKCGSVPSCKNCNTSLTYHSNFNELQCHYCGHRAIFNPACPDCGGKMSFCGRGTERLEEQLCELYPNAKVVRVDSDVAKRDHLALKLDSDWQIMIGTQFMLEHVLDWNGVKVVGVANADNMTSASDFRIHENAFRLVNLLGRRCREIGAELVVQSAKQDNDIINLALKDDYVSFYNREIKDREASLYPPFVRLIRIDMRARFEHTVFQAGARLERALRSEFDTRVSPLFQPYINKQSNEYVVHLLLKVERERSFSQVKEQLVELAKPSSNISGRSVSISYDVDPT